jgi:hypothetical protein
MHYPLMDITDRISEPPTWWLDGIPRYCAYDPDKATFARTNMLVRVCCQQCRRAFDVAIGIQAVLLQNVVEPVLGYPFDSKTGKTISEAHDDPPFHLRDDGFNCPGNPMIAEWIAILQVWERSRGELIRRPDLEGPSPDNFG